MSKKSKALDIQESLLLDLPSEIIANILSRLPVLFIISCKYVCKQLFQIISSPEFAKSHLSVSFPGLIVGQHRGHLFKLLEYEDMLQLQTHDLRDLKVMKFKPGTFMGTYNFRSLIRGSVNGLLCLVPSTTYLSSVYICNPITREYIHIPMPKHVNKAPYYFHRCGFGLSGLSGQYKVVVNYNEMGKNECLVYTLGTIGSWRSVAPEDASISGLSNQYAGLFMNGNLHWLVAENDSAPLISCFELETELFKSFPSPPISSNFAFLGSLGVLEDCLCLCDKTSDDDNVILWVMKEYGVEKSWTRKLAISHDLLQCSCTVCCENIFPITAFADGGILYMWGDDVLFYYCDKTKTTRLIEAFQEKGPIEKIIHTFSFLSLKRFGVENVISC